MSKLIDTNDREVIARLLPALRMMVRFPTRTAEVVSFETSVELADLKSWIAQRGRPNAKQIEALEKKGTSPKPSATQGARTTKETDSANETEATPPARHAPPATPRHHAPAPGPAPAHIPRGMPPVKSAPPPQNPKLIAPTSDIGRWLEQQRAKITARVNCFQVEVTPEIATAWLQFNTGNRNPSRSKIRRFAAAMHAGRWALNGETVKFSVSGRLIDGQSRLMAIQLAEVPAVLEVRAGLPDIAQQSMDSGELRKGAHMLEMLGEANAVTLAAALKIVWVWSKGWLGGFAFGSSRVMENGEVAPLLAEHTKLKASTGWTVSSGAKIDRLMPRSEGAFFHYLFGRSDVETRDAFFEALCDGIGLTKLSPVYHLRERLMADRGGVDTEPKKILRRALVIKAWNAAVAGEKVSRLAWTDDEAFPDVAGVATPEMQKPERKPMGGVLK